MKQQDSPDPEPYIDIQIALSKPESITLNLPSTKQLFQWVAVTLPKDKMDSELTIRIVNEAEIQQLNSQFRHQNKPTNVLSFPCSLPPEVNIPLLGDIVICAPIIQREAMEQGKELMAHWAHMVVHGTLHLLGYDHIDDTDAAEMETLETQLITSLGYTAPYGRD